ncbi:MAG: class I SAM-dependent methyltransferase [Candidatus Omnitrophica bacterium]|nr:class I SAM-dependent methyltransferase [Candidatus Omnitrophota bacterium]
MSIKNDWWKDFFNKIYLITDARSVLDEQLTCQEIDLVEDVLALNKNDRILDLCGGHGRHALELARRGYRALTVLDFSNYLINLGRKTAKKEGRNIKFVCGDARYSGLKSKDYSAIIIMANSFGYFLDQKENIRILKESYRLLEREGRLLLDLINPDCVKNNLEPISWHEANKDVVVCRQRELKRNIIKAREIVISKKKGLLRDGYYCEQIYNGNRITNILNNMGFKDLSIKKDISLHKHKKDYGFLTSRMIVTGVKP